MEWPKEFFELCKVGIGRFSIDPGIPIGIPVEEQKDLIFRRNRLMECNETFCQFYGLENSSKITDRPFFGGCFQTSSQLDKLFETLISENYRVVQSNIVHKLPDGSTKKILCCFTGIIESNCLTGLQIANHEVRNHENSLKSEREREIKYYDFFENAPDMFVSVSARTGKIIDCNKATSATLRYPKNEILGKPVFDLYTPESSDYAQKTIFPSFVKYGFINGEELQLQTKDGRVIDVLLSVSSVRDTEGNIVESRSIWRDITKLKRTETALQKTLEQLENLVEVRTVNLHQANEKLQKEIDSSQKIALELKHSKIRYQTVADFTYDWETWINPESNYIYVSPSCERISGYKPEEFMQNSELIIQIAHPDDRHLVMKHFNHRESSTTPAHSFDFRIIHKSGRIVWISHACTRVHDKEGNDLGRRGSNRDITDRVESQKPNDKND